jgi:hypothetical protein
MKIEDFERMMKASVSNKKDLGEYVLSTCNLPSRFLRVKRTLRNLTS